MPYFLTFQVAGWAELFFRKVYRDVILENLRNCRQVKDLFLFGYVIMSNHMHLVVQQKDGKHSEWVRNLPGIHVNTPKDPLRSCEIANVGVESMSPSEMAKVLMDKYQIYTVAIDGVGVRGCRISPNIYTSEKELDQFVLALKEMSGNS
jgi:selenocysteine lyase/cysteine desulfurase